MLTIIRSMKELSFGELMVVYRQGNREKAEEMYPDLPRDRGLAQAEQDFWQYLSQVFFRTPGGLYCLWQEGKRYVSALRLEPYQDGLLLEALETDPECRNQGYGTGLIRAVQAEFGAVKLYSHISKRNTPSIAVHEKCGFRKLLDHAVYIDGSVTTRAATYLYAP